MIEEEKILSIDELVDYMISMLAKKSGRVLYGGYNIKIPSEIDYLINEYISCADFYYDNVVSHIIDIDEYYKNIDEWRNKFIYSLTQKLDGMKKFHGKRIDFNTYTRDWIIDYVNISNLKELDKKTYKELEELCRWILEAKMNLIKEGNIDKIYARSIKKINK